MKRIFVLLSTVFLLNTALFARDTLTLIIFPFKSAAGIDEKRELITDQLRVDLINSREFILIDPFIVRDAMMEQGITLGDSIELDQLVEVGKEVDADVIISGSFGKNGESYSLNINMVSTVRGKSIFAQTYTIGEKNYGKDIKEIAQDVVTKGRVITQITLNDVRSLVEVGEYEDAEDALDTFMNFHHAERVSEDLRAMINEGIAKHAYERSQNLLAAYLFDDALIEINKAIAYMPEHTLYLKFVEEIEKERAQFDEKEQTELISTLKELVDDKRYGAAGSLIEVMYSRGFDSFELQELQNRVRRGVREKEHFQSAQKALWERDYIQARIEVREAIRINPKEPKYHEFLDELNEEEAKYRESQRVWHEYRSEFKNIDKVFLFNVKKPLQDGYNAALLFNRLSFRDKETVDEKKRWLNGLEGGYTWHRLLPYDLDLSSLATYYAFKTGARLSYGHEERIGSEDVNGFRSVSQERLLYGEVFGAAGVELSFLSYLLGLYSELNTGGFYSGNYYRNPGSNTETMKSSGYYVFGGGLSCVLGWLPSKNTNISLSYRYSWNLFLPQENIEKIRFSSISIDFGWTR